MSEVRPELLHLVGVDAVLDQAVGEETPCFLQVQALTLAGHFAAHKKCLYGQQWVTLWHDILRKNFCNSCLNGTWTKCIGKKHIGTKCIGTKRISPKRINVSATKHIDDKTYWRQNISATKSIGYKTYRLQNISATKHIAGQNVSATKRIGWF